MLDFLAGVVDRLVCYIQTAATLALNALIAAVGAIWAWAVGLLPAMPSVPSLPELLLDGADVAGWLFDVPWLLTYLAGYFVLIGAVFVVLIPLRWLKAVD
jgi:hypothetical protein